MHRTKHAAVNVAPSRAVWRCAAPFAVLRRRGLWGIAFGSMIVSIALGGCASRTEETSDVRVEVTMDPSPPMVGETDLTLRLTDAGGKAIEGAEIRVEGNMNHAGMKPSFAEMTEVEPGRYAGTLDFTMGGDWFLLVTATTPAGEVVERKVDVPGVRTQ